MKQLKDYELDDEEQIDKVKKEIKKEEEE